MKLCYTTLMKKQGPGFNPEEIIFCPTSLCNLKCAHCFVDQKNSRLNLNDALAFLDDCLGHLSDFKIGFSGGEPFLALDFVNAVCKKAFDAGLMFDRLMTNGIWWNNEDDLARCLTSVRDAGFDGKIGLSFDVFHGQPIDKIFTFIDTCHRIFSDNSCVEILSVIDAKDSKKDSEWFEKQIEEIKKRLDLEWITCYRFPQSFVPSEKIVLGDKKWFAEDYCQATGNVFYVHADGNIAPCCGFANERPELFIGTIKDSFETLMENSRASKMTGLCYETGLLSKAKELQKNKILSKGKCNDMCQLCYWMCRHADEI